MSKNKRFSFYYKRIKYCDEQMIYSIYKMHQAKTQEDKEFWLNGADEWKAMKQNWTEDAIREGIFIV